MLLTKYCGCRHFHACTNGQIQHRNTRSCRESSRKVGFIDLVHLRILLHVFEVNRYADDIIKCQAGFLQDCTDIFHDLMRFALEGLGLQCACFGIAPDLSRNEEKTICFYRRAERTDGFAEFRRTDDFFGCVWHTSGETE